MLALPALLALLAASCSDSDTRSGPAPGSTTTTAPPKVMVVVAASDGVGIGAANPETDAWPRVLARNALAPDTEVVNLAIPGATVATALQQMLPSAVQRQAPLNVVWLNVNDLIATVSPTLYEEQLQQLVSALRHGGDRRVLVANTPPLDRLPAYLSCQRPGDPCLLPSVPSPIVVRTAVAAYNAAIARVVQATGAELVDLHASALAVNNPDDQARLFGSDGFHPSTAGHQAIAEAFARVINHS